MFRRSSSKPLNLSFTTERIPTESAKEETVTRAFERTAVYGRCFIKVEEFQLGNSLFRAIFYLNETTSFEPSTCEHFIRIVVGRLDKCPFCDKDCAWSQFCLFFFSFTLLLDVHTHHKYGEQQHEFRGRESERVFSWASMMPNDVNLKYGWENRLFQTEYPKK